MAYKNVSKMIPLCTTLDNMLHHVWIPL